jgi:acetyl-CoA synthetase
LVSAATYIGINTGDGAKRDEDGYYWIIGRIDDVINVSGHRMGTAEVESALVLHPSVAEAAVVGFPHPVQTGLVRAWLLRPTLLTLLRMGEPHG